jgi:transcriptional regulator with XRE-family HTH domain
MGIREDFARNLRKIRAEKRMSQEQLALRAKVDRTYISSLERTVYAPTIDVVDRIARALKIEPALLFQKLQRTKPKG